MSHGTELQQNLNTLAARGRSFLSNWSFTRDLRLTMRDALVWLLAAPVVLFGVQVVLLLTSRGPLPLPIFGWAMLAVAGPAAFVVVRMAALAKHRQLDRRACLGAFDLQLESKDRLVTADQFIASLGFSEAGSSDPATRFKQAGFSRANCWCLCSAFERSAIDGGTSCRLRGVRLETRASAGLSFRQNAWGPHPHARRFRLRRAFRPVASRLTPSRRHDVPPPKTLRLSGSQPQAMVHARLDEKGRV